MKQTLQLKLTQHLTLTPQLQQSIRLLQLSTLELNAEVDRMLQENPLLEREDGRRRSRRRRNSRPAPRRDPVTIERMTRDEGDGDGDGDGMSGVDAAPTRDDLPDVTDFADYGGGGTDGDWGGGSSQRATRTSRRSRSPPARCAIT